MSVTGLKSFESSYCVFTSSTRSHRKLCWMFCLVLRNSLTIKPLFLASAIFRNDMFFINDIFNFFEHDFERGFEHGFEDGFEHGFEYGFEHGFEHGYEHGFDHGCEHGC